MIGKRLGPATLEVLQAIAAGHPYGFEIMDATGLAGGTVYPALAALERDGLVTSDWEAPEVARADKRPPRRYYAINDRGRGTLLSELARLRRLTSLLETDPAAAAGSESARAAAGAAADPSPGKP